MRPHLVRAARWLAGALTRAADRVEPRPLEQLATVPSGDPEGERANRIIGELQLRQALRRYAPDEERAQA